MRKVLKTRLFSHSLFSDFLVLRKSRNYENSGTRISRVQNTRRTISPLHPFHSACFLLFLSLPFPNLTLLFHCIIGVLPYAVDIRSGKKIPSPDSAFPPTLSSPALRALFFLPPPTILPQASLVLLLPLSPPPPPLPRSALSHLTHYIA